VPPDRPPDCLINFQTELAISKDDGNTTVTNNQLVTYQIVTTNIGPGRVVSAPVIDNFPTALTNISWTSVGINGGTATIASGTGNIDTRVSLPVGGSVVFTAQAIVAPNASGVFSNSASITVPDDMVDSNPDSNTSTDVNIIVKRPVASNDTFSVDEGNSRNVSAPGVLNNDTDADGDSISAALVSGPSNGTLTFNSDGSFIYTPAPDFNGTDTFTYKVNDGMFDSDVATVTIIVNPVNDTPVAADDNYSVNEDTALNVSAPGVLANDSDIDGDTLNPILVSGPTHGNLTLNANGSLNY